MAFFQKKPAAQIQAAAVGENILTSPLSGQIIPLSEVADETFSSGMLGEGLAIDPAEGALYAPADGNLAMVAETLHALAITTAGGAEILMHVGMDTVKMSGRGFKLYRKQGEEVKRGDLLLTFDLKAIKKAGYSAVTPITISNSYEYEVKPEPASQILAGEKIMVLTKK